METVSRLLFRCALAAAIVWTACSTPEQEFLGKSLSDWAILLDGEDRHDRLSAVRAIGEAARRNPADAASTAVLRRALSHEDSAVRHWAVRSVGSLGDAASAFEQDLRARLADDAIDVRIWAAQALCRLGKPEEALPVLARALSDTNGGTRLHAAHALEALGEDARPVVEALRGVLGDDFGYPDRVAGRFLKNLGALPESTTPD